MKKLILLFIAILARSSVYAQTSPLPVIYTLDTTLFRPANYQLLHDSKIKNLFEVMDGYYLENDSSIIHWGQETKRFTINGKKYTGLNIIKAANILPVNMLECIESVIDYKNVMSIGPRTPIIDETLNIRIKENKIIDAQQLLLSANILAIDEKVIKVRLCCADYTITSIAEQVAANMNGNTDPYTDDYGDQIPHFLIKPKPGTYTSTATRY